MRRRDILDIAVPTIIAAAVVAIILMLALALTNGSEPTRTSRQPTYSGFVDTGRGTSVYCIGWSGAASCDWEGEE